MKIHKKSLGFLQQPPMAVRPMVPHDGMYEGINNPTRQNTMPSGFVGVFDYGNGDQTKLSPTTVKERKVY